MVFAPKFQETGETEFIENVMAVVHRDMKPALDWFYLDTPTHLTRYGVANNVGATGSDLPDFALMTDGEIDVFSYPLLVLGVERMSSAETDDGWYLNQDLRIGAGLVVSDTTSVKNARIKARKYVRAFKAVIRSATAADLLPDSALILDHIIDIDHRYLRHGTNGTTFTQPVEFEIKIKFGEK